MIKTFRNKPLAALWAGKPSRIAPAMQERLIRRLDALNAAGRVEAQNIPGFNFHPLHGFRPVRYSLHVNGPWCVTFEFSGGDAYRVDFEQYH